jgi:hypothetical protein
MTTFIRTLLTIIGSFQVGLGYTQKTLSFELNGKLEGLKKGTILYLVRNSEHGGVDTLSWLTAKGNTFVFQGKISAIGEPLFIKFDTNHVKNRSYIWLIMEPRKIIVTGSMQDLSWEKILVTGSKAHTEFVEFKLTGSFQVKTRRLSSLL